VDGVESPAVLWMSPQSCERVSDGNRCSLLAREEHHTDLVLSVSRDGLVGLVNTRRPVLPAGLAKLYGGSWAVSLGG
jgi:hypothetical protein